MEENLEIIVNGKNENEESYGSTSFQFIFFIFHNFFKYTLF